MFLSEGTSKEAHEANVVGLRINKENIVTEPTGCSNHVSPALTTEEPVFKVFCLGTQ